MQALVDFISGIGSFIGVFFEFLFSTIKGLVDVVVILVRFLAFIPDYFLWLPDSILAIVVAIFTGAVVYKILGRDG